MMKKFRLILAVLTIISGIYMIYANVSVSGYRLLTMNSTTGHQMALTYRWSIVIFLVLIVLNLLTASVARRQKRKRTICPACGAAHRENDKFCKKCGYSFRKNVKSFQ